MRRILLAILLLFQSLALFGQTSDRITGIVKEEDTSQPAIQAAVVLISVKDSCIVDGTVTDEDGQFYLSALPGDYVVKFSLMGFFSKTFSLHKTPSTEPLNLGTIALAPDVQMLKGAVVQARVDPVTIVEDTVVYNAAAYRVAADASLEELVRKIPGLELSSGGQVTLHGRPINQLLVNGKRFFGTNVRTGLKNLSADMVENIKAYERESDEARLSGVDDGESEPVLDITVKKHMLDRWRVNINAGGGTSSRYAAKANANMIGKDRQFSAVAGRRNVVGTVGIGVTNINQVGHGSSGDADVTEAGFSFATKKGKSDWSGNFHYGDRYTDQQSNGRSETINASSNSWGCSLGTTGAISPNIKLAANGELHPDQYNSWLINPTFTFEYSGRHNKSLGRSFNGDPYDTGYDPAEYMEFDIPGDPFEDIRQNSTNNASASYYNRVNGAVSVQYSHVSKIKRRRSYSIKANVSLTGSGTDAYNTYRTRYYRIVSNPDSLSTKMWYNDIGDRSIYSTLQFTWSEPFKKGFYFQSIYRLEYRHVLEDKACYDIASVDRGWSVKEVLFPGEQKNALPAGWQGGYSDMFSYACTYDVFVHNIILSGKISRKKIYSTFGVTFKPVTGSFKYMEDGLDKLANTFSFHVVPNFLFRYTFSKTNKISVRFNSRTSSPSLSSLMPVINGTNPLNVRTGNPYLAIPLINEATLSYNFSNLKKQTSFVCNLNWTMTDNAVSTSCEYNTETGARTYTPKNIDGNWKVSGSTALTKSFGKGAFSITNHASGEFRNDASYLYNSKLKEDQVNNTSRLMLRELFEGSFRSSWFEAVLGAGINFTDESSSLRPAANQSPLTYVLNSSVVASAPWKMRLETDFSVLMQRGYTYAELNKNYYVWNAELSQPFLKKGVVRLAWYDILRSMENLTRSFSSSRRAITAYNGVNSYVLLRVSWTF